MFCKSRACCSSHTYPVSGADDLVGGSGAGAEVEILNREAFVVEADTVSATRCAVLHVAQIGVSVNHHMSTTDTHTHRQINYN